MSEATHHLHPTRLPAAFAGSVETRALLRSMLAMTDFGILVTDLQHRPLGVNGRFGELFRVDSERVPTMGVEELRGYVYPRLRDPEAWRRQLEATYADEEAILEDELELIDDGRSTYLRRHTGPLRDENGDIVGRLWTFEDISALKMRERRNMALLEISTFHDPSPAIVCRRVTEIVANVYQSTAILSIWSGDRMLFREVVGAPEGFESIRENRVTDSYCQVALRTVKPVMIQNALLDREVCNIPPAQMGLTRYVGAPIRTMSGRPIGTLCFIDTRSDLPVSTEDGEFVNMMAARISTELERERLFDERSTAQREAIQRQRLDLARTQQVLGAMNQAFALLGSRHGISSLLREQTTLLRGVLNFNAAAILNPLADGYETYAVRQNQHEVLQIPMEEATVEYILSKCPQPMGVPVACEIDLPPIRRWTSAPFGVIARLSDSERPPILLFAMESKLDEADLPLMTHVTALVDQVALLLLAHRLQDEIRDAKVKLIETEKLSVVGTLAASIAHDIRNILSAISLEIAMAGNPEETLKSVRRHIDRFSVLSHRLLSYVKPRFLAREYVRIDKILTRSIAMLGAQAKVTGVELSVDVASDLPVVVADPHRAEHLFVNLIVNALQAMHTRGGVIRVIARNAGNAVVVAVQDNGHGIAPEILKSIFEPFTSAREDGFGLGLYSCRQIAEEHGWKLDLQSTIGEGSTFTITIPLTTENPS